MVEQGTKPALKAKRKKTDENTVVQQISQIISQNEAKANEKIDLTIL
jgi:hypothetical protein